MEKEGLVRAVEFLKKEKFKIGTLVTTGINKLPSGSGKKWLRQITVMMSGIWLSVS